MDKIVPYVGIRKGGYVSGCICHPELLGLQSSFIQLNSVLHRHDVIILAMQYQDGYR
jgi:hypothetical protein